MGKLGIKTSSANNFLLVIHILATIHEEIQAKY